MHSANAGVYDEAIFFDIHPERIPISQTASPLLWNPILTDRGLLTATRLDKKQFTPVPESC